MQITLDYNINGELEKKTIEVTDLPLAIKEAKQFVSFSKEAKDEKKLKYWENVLSKLKELEK